MTVTKNSRYESEYIFYDPDDKELDFIDPVRAPLFDKPSDSDYLVRVSEGMSLDVLAYQYYGTPELQWAIMDANPNLEDPGQIKPGDVLVIPNPARVVNRNE